MLVVSKIEESIFIFEKPSSGSLCIHKLMRYLEDFLDEYYIICVEQNFHSNLLQQIESVCPRKWAIKCEYLAASEICPPPLQQSSLVYPSIWHR